MADSLPEIAVSMMAKIDVVTSEMRDVNDWSEATGLCQEFDRLYQDADQQMRSLRARAMHLSARIKADSTQRLQQARE